MSVDDDVGEQLADAHFGLVAHVVGTLEQARLLFCDCLSELVNYKVPSLGLQINLNILTAWLFSYCRTFIFVL